jgi:hypothetical protein
MTIPEVEEAGMGSWTPILSADGQYYCSPRCGGGHFCRKEWYDSAVSNAAKLAEVMGDGWTPNVFENLGWYYDASNGIGRITTSIDHRDGSVTYTAWINTPEHQFITHNRDPQEAWGMAVQDARTFMARLQADLADILNGTALRTQESSNDQ